jgi:hypothetical protein
MLRFRFSNGVISIELDLRGFSSVWRLVALGVHEFFYLGIHPAGRSPRSILRRARLERPL